MSQADLGESLAAALTFVRQQQHRQRLPLARELKLEDLPLKPSDRQVGVADSRARVLSPHLDAPFCGRKHHYPLPQFRLATRLPQRQTPTADLVETDPQTGTALGYAAWHPR